MFDVDRRRLLLSTIGTVSTGSALLATAAPAGADESGDGEGRAAADASTPQRRSDRTRAADTDDAEPDAAGAVEFLDRETVRVTEPAADVIVSLFWWDESGAVGTIAEPVGAVDGERTISATEEFGTFAYGPVVTDVELFEAETPVVPGIGDTRSSNPDVESHVASVRDAHDGPEDLEPSRFDP